jgi:hypothetical protein
MLGGAENAEYEVKHFENVFKMFFLTEMGVYQHPGQCEKKETDARLVLLNYKLAPIRLLAYW